LRKIGRWTVVALVLIWIGAAVDVWQTGREAGTAEPKPGGIVTVFQVVEEG
jgi:hypothetical protein